MNKPFTKALSITSSITVAAVLVFHLVGDLPIEVLIIAVLLKVFEVLKGLEDDLGKANIKHRHMDVIYKNGIWIFQMDNHAVYTNRAETEQITDLLNKTLNPTSDSNTIQF